MYVNSYYFNDKVQSTSNIEIKLKPIKAISKKSKTSENSANVVIES